MLACFAEAEESAQIFDKGQSMDGDAIHWRRPAAHFGYGLRELGGVERPFFGAGVTNNPSRVADDDGVWRDVASDNRTRSDHRAFSDRDAWQDRGIGADGRAATDKRSG